MKCFGARTSGRSPWGGRTARRRGEGRAQLAACKILGIWLPSTVCLCAESSACLCAGELIIASILPATRLQTFFAALQSLSLDSLTHCSSTHSAAALVKR